MQQTTIVVIISNRLTKVKFMERLIDRSPKAYYKNLHVILCRVAFIEMEGQGVDYFTNEFQKSAPYFPRKAEKKFHINEERKYI